MKVFREKIKKWYPLFLSILIPGLGQLIKGQWKKSAFIIISLFLLYYGSMEGASFIGTVFDNIFLALFYYLTGRLALLVFYLWQVIDIYSTIHNNHSLKNQQTLLPILLSLVLPGSGQLIKKQLFKGLGILIGGPVLFFMSLHFVLQSDYPALITILLFYLIAVAVMGIYIWQVFDVGKQTEKQPSWLKRFLTIVIVCNIIFGSYFVNKEFLAFRTGKQLSENYFQHKEAFHSLAAKIQEENEKGIKLAGEALANPESIIGTNIGLTDKAIEFYRREGKKIGIKKGFHASYPDTIMFVADTWGISISGGGTGYVYATRTPENMFIGECDYQRAPLKDIDAFEGCNNQSYTVYQQIDKNWYIYRDFED